MISSTGISQLKELLSVPAGGKAAARCLIASELIDQFRTAQEISTENLDGYGPLPGLDQW